MIVHRTCKEWWVDSVVVLIIAIWVLGVWKLAEIIKWILTR